MKRDCKPSLKKRVEDGDSQPTQSRFAQRDEGGCSGEITALATRRSTTLAGLSVPLPCHGFASESLMTIERSAREKYVSNWANCDRCSGAAALAAAIMELLRSGLALI